MAGFRKRRRGRINICGQVFNLLSSMSITDELTPLVEVVEFEGFFVRVVEADDILVVVVAGDEDHVEEGESALLEEREILGNSEGEDGVEEVCGAFVPGSDSVFLEGVSDSEDAHEVFAEFLLDALDVE